MKKGGRGDSRKEEDQRGWMKEDMEDAEDKVRWRRMIGCGAP